MKDYSEFIKEEAGFITKINPIVEEGVVEVTTSKTKKGKPHRYKLTKKTIDKLYKRLENQYKLLIENKEVVFNQMNKNIMNVFKWIRYAGIGVLIITFIIAMISIATGNINLLLPQIIGLLISGGIHYTTTSIMKDKEKKFDEMIETYRYYIEHRGEIEALTKVDTNVISALDDKTQTELDESQRLVDTGLTDELFSIQFMDKVSLKQLKEIIERYQISMALDKEQYFYVEDYDDEELIEEEKGFSKKRKKEM